MDRIERQIVEQLVSLGFVFLSTLIDCIRMYAPKSVEAASLLSRGVTSQLTPRWQTLPDPSSRMFDGVRFSEWR
jgi:hypothetical protein